MDFHSLTRRELQTLCKKNKIPANMTNIAMADALQALENVEGLEELLTQTETETPKTPAKSITSSGITRTSNRRRNVKEEPESSKLTTRTRRGTKKAEGESEKGKENMPEAAASSACAKVLVAPSKHRNVETSHLNEGKKSSALRVYSTRRSTRLLEKKMGELSLKENGDTVDVKANLEKDSQDLQRQFSEDLEDSQVLEVVPENKIFSDESNVATEVMEESSVEEVPEQNVDVLMENKTVDSSPVDELEELIKDNESNDDEGQALKKDAEQLDEAVKKEAEQLDEVSHTDVSSDEFETQHNVTVIHGTQDAVSQPISENEEVVFLGSELTTSENDGLAIAAEDNISFSEITSVLAEIEQGIDDTQEAIPETSELDTESDNDSDNNQNFTQLVDSIYNNNENLCAVNILIDNEVAPESLLAGDVHVDQLQVTPCKSSSKKSVSARPMVHFSDNKENIEISDKKTVNLQDENACAVIGTPIDKKSLRQLRKMVKGLYQQAEERRALQMRVENVMAGISTKEK